MSVSGRGAKQKGSRFERQVRNELRRIYDVERRSAIQRVPLSGASHFKGDVVDMNDTEWSYECKKQETLCLPDWWRQTKRQSKSYQIPCLVFSSNNRPIYWVIEKHHWQAFLKQLGVKYKCVTKTNKLYDRLAEMEHGYVLEKKLDGDTTVIIPNELFIDMRRRIYELN